MITVYPYNRLGHANHGWLDARHHFSFAQYWNANRQGFGVLRVINDDAIAPGAGFGMHGHANMEIITYVRQGAITHQDSLGNKGRTAAGAVQVMSAGTGVQHSEYNHESTATRLYQLWITPHTLDVAPRWELRSFPQQPLATGGLPLLVSGRAEDADSGALFIHQDAAIYGGRVAAGGRLAQAIKGQAYILASANSITVNGTPMQQGDGAEVVGIPVLHIAAQQEAELLVIDVPRS